MNNEILAVFGGRRRTKTRPVWRNDHGMVLKFADIELPPTYEVHFSNNRTTAAKVVLGDADGVVIPAEYFHGADEVYAWLYLHSGADDGFTAYEVLVPLQLRPDTTNEQPTPEEKSIIEQAIQSLNDALGEVDAIRDAFPDATDQDIGKAIVVKEVEEGKVKSFEYGEGVVMRPYDDAPKMDGVADPGADTRYARGDHVHPRDTGKADVATVPVSADISNTGLVVFRNGSAGVLFSVQLPLYDGAIGPKLQPYDGGIGG